MRYSDRTPNAREASASKAEPMRSYKNVTNPVIHYKSFHPLHPMRWIDICELGLTSRQRMTSVALRL